MTETTPSTETADTPRHGALTVLLRTDRGKGPARRLRTAGRVPGVLYGQGKDNLAVSIDPKELRFALDPALRWNTYLEVTVKAEGESDRVERCMVADFQVDALRDVVTHLDLMRVDPDTEVQRRVPVAYSGRSIGVAAGGKLFTFRRELMVACKPGDMPAVIQIDVTPLNGGDRLLVRDLVIPNARVLARPDTALALVEAAKAKVEEKTDDKKKKK
jgi:large subunit ribosomal protein L25